MKRMKKWMIALILVVVTLVIYILVRSLGLDKLYCHQGIHGGYRKK